MATVCRSGALHGAENAFLLCACLHTSAFECTCKHRHTFAEKAGPSGEATSKSRGGGDMSQDEIKSSIECVEKSRIHLQIYCCA